MTHPIVQAWARGENDAGGTIADLERALVASEAYAGALEELLREFHGTFVPKATDRGGLCGWCKTYQMKHQADCIIPRAEAVLAKNSSNPNPPGPEMPAPSHEDAVPGGLGPVSEFEVYVGDEMCAATAGPREEALAEARHYAMAAEARPVRIEEVTRRVIEEISTVLTRGT